ncbi:restriction endonuclease subunit S [Algibacter luteus]|uniref:restriction endonuclease subunit S n=1 Tax=Algibacter luteus TaxID=1178825 RepID=UPI002591E029|nr:restriction endonuclease subunit S [Algibacter luteus]WJJ96344.1 restriction endonuclease subunit S [Algibacter luteus]
MEYNELKNTSAIWIPEIPKHWDLIKVRHLFKESSIKGFPNEPLLVASQKHGVVNKDVYGQRTMEATKDFHNLKLVEKGDFVISLRSFQGGIEYAHQRGIISPAYTILKELKPINKRYFKHLFKSKPFISLMTLCVKGIRDGQNIDFPTFKGEFLPVPPIEEQEAIGAYLDKKTKKIKEFIKKKKRLIELLEEEKRGIVNIAISRGDNPNVKLIDTGIEWLGKVPSHWSVKKIKYITTLIADGTHQTPVYTENGYPFLRITDINGDKINWDEVRYISEKEHKSLTKTRKGRKGDILLSKNGTIGKVIEVTWDEEFSFFVSLCLIRFKKSILPKYFSYFFKSDIVFDQLNEGSKTTSVTNLHLEKIKELRIAYPEITEQEKICKYLDIECGKVDVAISKAKLEIEKANEYQESLITQVVTGQLKVPTLKQENVLS